MKIQTEKQIRDLRLQGYACKVIIESTGASYRTLRKHAVLLAMDRDDDL